MSDLNLCQFIGRLGRDPEVRYLPNGDAVCNFSIAVGQQWKDKSGDKKEQTEWVRCNAFAKLAEICGQYLKKGKQVYVSGQMNTRKWTDKDGVEKYTTEIRVNQMQMLGDSGQAKPDADPGNARGHDGDDDIPF
jgi:single-strand DNA-binding protein